MGSHLFEVVFTDIPFPAYEARVRHRGDAKVTQPWSPPPWGSVPLETGPQALWWSATTQLPEMQSLDFFSQLITGPLSQCRRRHSLTSIDLGV